MDDTRTQAALRGCLLIFYCEVFPGSGMFSVGIIGDFRSRQISRYTKRHRVWYQLILRSSQLHTV